MTFCLLLCIINSDEKLFTFMLGSVADLDPGSGVFFTPGSGSGLGKKSGSGMNIPDSFSESFETILGLKKHLKFFDADPDL
jgi:hypothetical protein